MNEKEKAEELLNLFLQNINYKNNDGEIIVHKEPYTSAKQCALICVDEKFDLLNKIYDEFLKDEYSIEAHNFISEMIIENSKLKSEIQNL